MSNYMSYKKIREEITFICQKMWQLGWVAANDGNVSVKAEDGNIIATPTGISKMLIKPEMLVVLNQRGDVIDGNRKPSSEIKMHLKCYAERPDVGAVIHAHPATATGFAVAGIPLDRYSMIETVVAIGSVPIVPYATPSTVEVPNAIAPYLKEHDVMLLANHGALTVGADLLTAYYRMETLELFAKISLVAHQLGGAKEIDEANINRLIELRKFYGVTGKHPGYKHYRKESPKKEYSDRPKKDYPKKDFQKKDSYKKDFSKPKKS
ncbi:MAG: class II aldolase/adducin family protein [Christensenellales bacterium]|jgi:L-fuculose-phosphate aldolase